jgi:hypothetical protein
MVRMGKGLLAGAIIALNLCGPVARASSAASEDDIRHWLALWQRREGLGWLSINLRIVRQSELPRNVIGDVDWWETPGQAHIRVVCAEDLETVYDDTPAKARSEIERTVIHELMHLVLFGLYDDGSGRGQAWLGHDPASNARVEAITDNLAVMLLSRRVPGGVPVARYIVRQSDSGPWKAAADVKERIVLQVVRAMNAATEDDVLTLFAQR